MGSVDLEGVAGRRRIVLLASSDLCFFVQSLEAHGLLESFYLVSQQNCAY